MTAAPSRKSTIAARTAEHTTALAIFDAVEKSIRGLKANHAGMVPVSNIDLILNVIRAYIPERGGFTKNLLRIDYLEKVQILARGIHEADHAPDLLGPQFDAIAGVDTPLGRLKAIVWRRQWSGQRERTAWAAEYYLDDEPVTVAEIRKAGLAERPTKRVRGKK